MKIRFSTRVMFALLAGGFVTLVPREGSQALAVCSQSEEDVSLSDSAADSFLTANGCPVRGENGSYVQWHYDNFRMKDDLDDWKNRGFNDACDEKFEFSRHWMSGYLITFGLFNPDPRPTPFMYVFEPDAAPESEWTYDNYWNEWEPSGFPWNPMSRSPGSIDMIGRSFHSRSDYRRIAMGEIESRRKKYHDHFNSHISDSLTAGSDDSWAAYANYQKVNGPDYDHVSVSCLLFEGNEYDHNNLSARASSMIHEGWHSALRHQRYKNDHQSLQGDFRDYECADGILSCDGYYYHPLSKFGPGDLNEADSRGFHTVHQVQYEFLCDMTGYPARWVPVEIEATLDMTRVFMRNFGFFKETPPPRGCGPYTPLGLAPSGPGGSNCETDEACTRDLECASNACSSSGCCVPVGFCGNLSPCDRNGQCESPVDRCVADCCFPIVR